MTLRTLVLGACALALVACTSKPAAAPPAQPPPPPRPAMKFETTVALVKDPELQKRVDALAAMKRLESAATGVAAAPSAVFAAWKAVQEKAAEDDLVALLRHEAANVRAYAARHVIRSLAARAAAVKPLLADDSRLPTTEGCMLGEQAVGELVLDALCDSKGSAEAGAVLVAAARDDSLGDRARTALVCAGKVGAAEAAALAREKLAPGQPPATVAAALGVLARADPQGICTAALPLAAHDAPEIRVAVAKALSACPDPAAGQALEKLLADPKDPVKVAAGGAWLGRPGRDAARAAEMMKDQKNARAWAFALAGQRTEEAVATLEPYLLALAAPGADPKAAEAGARLFDQLRAEPRPDAVTAMVRRIAKATEPDRSRAYVSVRSETIRYLYELGDRADLPELRRSLRSWSNRELDFAFQAVARHKDLEAVPTLEAMVGEKNALAKKRAAQALFDLGAKASAAAVEKGADSGDPKLDAELKALARKLRELP